MGLRNKKLVKYMWKKWTSTAGVIVFVFILFRLFICAYECMYVGAVKNLGSEYIHGIKYSQIRYAFKNKNDTTYGNNMKVEDDVTDNYGVHGLTSALKRISQNDKKTVMVSVINKGYLNLTYNWLCNTKKWNIHSQVLFIVFDKETESALKMDWPEVTPIYYGGIDDTSGFSYATVGYARIVLKRVEVMLKMIKHNVTMFLFETDSVWFRNPIPYLEQETSGYDIAITKMSTLDIGEVGYCICFLYIYPTKIMNKFWDKMFQNMTLELERIKSFTATSRVNHYPSFSMQKVFSRLINQRYGDVKYLVLPAALFPDGYEYNKKSKLIGKTHAFLLHNNYIAGNDRKIQRAKDAGHWFLNNDMTCTN